MPVVGTNGNFMVDPARASPPRFFVHHSADHAHHIRTAGQMFRFMKRSVGLSRHLPKVHKMNATTKFASHCEQIVIGSRSERSNTKRQPIFERIATSKNRSHILG